MSSNYKTLRWKKAVGSGIERQLSIPQREAYD